METKTIEQLLYIQAFFQAVDVGIKLGYIKHTDKVHGNFTIALRELLKIGKELGYSNGNEL